MTGWRLGRNAIVGLGPIIYQQGKVTIIPKRHPHDFLALKIKWRKQYRHYS